MKVLIAEGNMEVQKRHKIKRKIVGSVFFQDLFYTDYFCAVSTLL